MSILSGPEIAAIVEYTRRLKADWSEESFREYAARTSRHSPPQLITIDPFDPARCGPNSYDVHLAPRLKVYDLEPYDVLDPRAANPTQEWDIPEQGYVLSPGRLYLASTVERTWCAGLVPWIEGWSSVGRLGLSIHATAGFGDDGFDGHWTLEMSCVHPVRVYPGMRIGQLVFSTLVGERKPYAGRYQGQAGPTESRFHL